MNCCSLPLFADVSFLVYSPANADVAPRASVVATIKLNTRAFIGESPCGGSHGFNSRRNARVPATSRTTAQCATRWKFLRGDGNARQQDVHFRAFARHAFDFQVAARARDDLIDDR